MKITELFETTPKHTSNDLIYSIRKVIEGSSFNSEHFKLKSSDTELAKGNLIFMHNGKTYKITLNGRIYESTHLLTTFEPSADIHHHYSHGLHLIGKYLKDKETKK
jgi:hypothetical protein